MDNEKIKDLFHPEKNILADKIIRDTKDFGKDIQNIDLYKIKISVARCARLSYNTFDGEINYEKDIKLHDQLLGSKHLSPFEHVCKMPTPKEISGLGNGFTHVDYKGDMWSGNFKGWIQYRQLLENIK